MTASSPSVPTPSLASKVQVIAHRGASALRPEHTLAAYAKAIADGADFIEPDLVMTRDGVMVARHESRIDGTTDVARHARFAARRTSKTIDGRRLTGWFAEDFTLAELKTLHARERLPDLRGTAYDGRYPIATLDEIIALAAAESAVRGRTIGLIPEIKHGTYFRQIGLPMEDALLAALAAHLYTRHAPVEIQSFEVANLEYLRGELGAAHPNIRLLQLVDAPDRTPGDVLAVGGTLTYAEMLTPAGLKAMATYADAIGPDYHAITPYDAHGRPAPPTSLVRGAHAVGLEVHPYTFRPENAYLAKPHWKGGAPGTVNREGMITELRACLDAGIDAFFTDDPAAGRLALERA